MREVVDVRPSSQNGEQILIDPMHRDSESCNASSYTSRRRRRVAPALKSMSSGHAEGATVLLIATIGAALAAGASTQTALDADDSRSTGSRLQSSCSSSPQAGRSRQRRVRTPRSLESRCSRARSGSTRQRLSWAALHRFVAATRRGPSRPPNQRMRAPGIPTRADHAPRSNEGCEGTPADSSHRRSGRNTQISSDTWMPFDVAIRLPSGEIAIGLLAPVKRTASNRRGAPPSRGTCSST
jgi:hypothetical protein